MRPCASVVLAKLKQEKCLDVVRSIYFFIDLEAGDNIDTHKKIIRSWENWINQEKGLE